MTKMAGNPEEMEVLVARIARAVVDDSRQVMVKTTRYKGGTWLRVRVAQSDVARMIGQQGRTVGAVRAILAAVASKHRHRYMLDVFEGTKDRDAR